jgi:hypothetical protein
MPIGMNGIYRRILLKGIQEPSWLKPVFCFHVFTSLKAGVMLNSALQSGALEANHAALAMI